MSTVGPVSSAATAGFGHNPHTPTAHPGGSPHGRDGRRRPAADWHEALTELEGEVLAAESTMVRGRADEIASWGRRAEDWVPPSGLGPIPEDLRERAARLLQHQLAVAEALVEAIIQSQRQRDVAARMSYAPDRPVASFVDRAL